MESQEEKLKKKIAKLYQAEQLAKINEILKKNLKLVQGNSELLAYLAVSEDGNPDKMIECAEQSLALKENAMAYLALGYAFTDKSDFAKAIVHYTSCIKIDENMVSALYSRGNAHSELLDYFKAFQDYDAVIAKDPNHASALENRGILHYQLGEYEDAKNDYVSAIERNEDLGVHVNYGDLLDDVGDYDGAIAQYQIVINKKEKELATKKGCDVLVSLENAYYNIALTYEFLGDYEMALHYFQKYNDLIISQNSGNGIAISEIESLKRKLKIGWNANIDKIIKSIKTHLVFEGKCVTHYTSLSGAKAMILGGSEFRLSEGSFLNDPSEGKELLKFLSYSIDSSANQDTLKESFSERPFIGSFVPDDKNNDLTLWRMYGKESNTEAKGCALTINRRNFIINNLKIQRKRRTKTFTFYQVAYNENGKFIIPGKLEDKANEEFNKLLHDLKDIVHNLDGDQKAMIKPKLNDIAYLFKTSEYKYEHEVRLIVDGNSFEKKIVADILDQRVYINLLEIAPVLEKVTLGPKVERPDAWAAVFNYGLKEKDIVSDFEIVMSHLPFR